jgi:hypothetical protein
MSTDELHVVRQQIPSIRIRTSTSKTNDFRLAVQSLMLVLYSVLGSDDTGLVPVFCSVAPKHPIKACNPHAGIDALARCSMNGKA